MKKPLLAYTLEDTSTLAYPVMASVKLDGIRCIVSGGVALSRTLKPIRNTFIQSVLGSDEYEGFDGELIVGDLYDKACYRNTNSGVMREEGEPEFCYHVFDRTDSDLGFEARYASLASSRHSCVVPHYKIFGEAELLDLEARYLEQGAEGIMVRSLGGRYKEGRSTAKEGILGKLKRFSDAEFEVVGYEERMHNGNEKTTSALGYSERSSHQENKRGRGDLGALRCRTPEGVTFNVGTGFTDEERAALWAIKDCGLIGRSAKVKFFAIGVKDAPRFPVFLGFRDRLEFSL